MNNQRPNLSQDQLLSAIQLAADASYIGCFINRVKDPFAAYHLLSGAVIANIMVRIEDDQWAHIQTEFLLPCTHKDCDCFAVREKCFIGLDAIRTQARTVMAKADEKREQEKAKAPADLSRN